MKSYAKKDTLNILMKFLIVMNIHYDEGSGGMDTKGDMVHIGDRTMFYPFSFSQYMK